MVSVAVTEMVGLVKVLSAVLIGSLTIAVTLKVVKVVEGLAVSISVKNKLSVSVNINEIYEVPGKVVDTSISLIPLLIIVVEKKSRVPRVVVTLRLVVLEAVELAKEEDVMTVVVLVITGMVNGKLSVESNPTVILVVGVKKMVVVVKVVDVKGVNMVAVCNPTLTVEVTDVVAVKVEVVGVVALVVLNLIDV